MWAPKEISATLKVREVRYFIKHQFGGIPPPLPQGEGRQMRGGQHQHKVGSGRRGGEEKQGAGKEGRMEALSRDPDRVRQLKRLIWLTTFFKMQIYTCGHSHHTVNA